VPRPEALKDIDIEPETVPDGDASCDGKTPLAVAVAVADCVGDPDDDKQRLGDGDVEMVVDCERLNVGDAVVDGVVERHRDVVGVCVVDRDWLPVADNDAVTDVETVDETDSDAVDEDEYVERHCCSSAVFWYHPAQ